MAAARLKPSDPRIMDTLGYVLLKNNKNKDANNILESALKLLPDNSTVKLHLAMAKMGLGTKEEALRLLQSVVETGTAADVDTAKNLMK